MRARAKYGQTNKDIKEEKVFWRSDSNANCYSFSLCVLRASSVETYNAKLRNCSYAFNQPKQPIRQTFGALHSLTRIRRKIER